MKRIAIGCVLGLTMVAAGGGVASAQAKSDQEMKVRPVPQTAEWQKLRSLVGQWEGTFQVGDKTLHEGLEVRMTGDGSAIMHIMGKDTPQEMLTIFHPDGDRLLATHYCAAHNQPRMALTKAPGPNQVAFEFVDGTNIRPGDGHIAHVVLTFIDADHHDETWTHRVNGKDGQSAVFHYARKK